MYNVSLVPKLKIPNDSGTLIDHIERLLRAYGLNEAGEVIMSHVSGDLDDITDGTTYGRVLQTNLVSGDVDHGSIAGLSNDDHPQYIKDTEFTQNSGILVGTGAGTFAEETGATLRTSIGTYSTAETDSAIDTDIATHAALADPHTGYLKETSLSDAQATDLTDTGDSELHYHASDRARGNHTGIQLATTVEVSELNTATYDDAQDYINFFGDRTLLSGGGITDNGNGTATVAAGTAWAKATDSDTAVGKFFNFPADNSVSITDLITNYVYLDYNAGTPQIVVTTASIITYGFKQDHIHLATIFRDGTTLHFHEEDALGIGRVNIVDMRLLEMHDADRASGLVTSDGGSLALSVTPGVVYEGLSRHTTSVNGSTWATWYYDGNLGTPAWVEVTGQSTIDNENYNDVATGLASLTANRYAVHWVYVDIDGENLFIVYGQGDYTINQAEEAGVPSSLPDIAVHYGVLIAKVIVQKSQTTLEILYPWTTTFHSSLATDHGSLAGLTDSDHPQYILNSLFDAQTILAATADDTPAALTITEQTLVGRITSGNIAALSIAQVRTLLSISNVEDTAHSSDAHTMTIDGRDVSTDGTKLDTIATNADVTGSNPPQAHKDSHDPQDGSDPLDTAAAAEISVVVAAGGGSSHSFARADHVHAINHAITDNHVATIDGTTNAPANLDFAKWTTLGLEGRSYTETKQDLSLDNVENTVHSTDGHTMTIDGRDVSVDGSKLDGIEATADITDYTNVAAALAAATGAVNFNDQDLTGVGDITFAATKGMAGSLIVKGTDILGSVSNSYHALIGGSVTEEDGSVVVYGHDNADATYRGGVRTLVWDGTNTVIESTRCEHTTGNLHCSGDITLAAAKTVDGIDISAIPTTYMPLGGGSFAGNVAFAAACTTLYKSVDNSYLGLYGGATNGPKVEMTGKDHTFAGDIRLYVTNTAQDGRTTAIIVGAGDTPTITIAGNISLNGEMTLAASKGLKYTITSSNVANPPTDAELDALFTGPATVGAGWSHVVQDNAGTDTLYQIVSDGSAWWVFTGVKAV